MLASQIVAFRRADPVGNPWLFGGLICYVLLCYGGGFGTMPAFVLDVFGPRPDAGRVRSDPHGLVGRGDRGSAVGRLSDDHHADKLALYAGNAVIVAVGFILSLTAGRKCSISPH